MRLDIGAIGLDAHGTVLVTYVAGIRQPANRFNRLEVITGLKTLSAPRQRTISPDGFPL